MHPPAMPLGPPSPAAAPGASITKFRSRLRHAPRKRVGWRSLNRNFTGHGAVLKKCTLFGITPCHGEQFAHTPMPARSQNDKVVAAYRRTDFFDRRQDLMAQWANYALSTTEAPGSAA